MADDYDRMRSAAAKRWQTAQRLAGRQLAHELERLRAMPDVMARPGPTELYRHEGMTAPDGNAYFTVLNWVTVNGVLHRIRVRSTSDGWIGVWDVPTGAWI